MNKYLIAAVVALVTVVGLYQYGHHKGWTQRDQEMQAEIARKNEEARELERAMNSKIIANANKLQEANHALDKKQTDLNAAIRAGRVRLPTASCVQASPSVAPATGDSPEAPSESDRETLRLIAEIAADGDRAINQLNSCIDSYNEMRNTVNGQR